MTAPLTDFDRLCIHTMTNKPWSLRECIDGYTRAGVPAISVWHNVFKDMGSFRAGQMLKSSGLKIASLCRCGFFPAKTAKKRQDRIDANLHQIDEALELGAPMIVLVCGSDPDIDLAEGRRQIADGIAAILPHAAEAGIRLAIEPLHPMYADNRSAISTLAQANDIVEALGHENVGVAIDVYHLWWDPGLESEIRRAADRIFAFHVCDWRTPTRDLLNDRGLMGEGCVPLRRIRGWVEAAGFDGPIEVEIFSDEFWSGDQAAYVEQIKEAYLNNV
jgi:sugar phosphate isomerase/epimerase